MKIKRTINGIEHEFELTKQERLDAYCEQEHIWDAAYVWYICSEEIEEMYKNEDEQDGFVEDIAYEMRRQIDKYDVSEWYALDEAFKKVTNQREKEGKQHDARS